MTIEIADCLCAYRKAAGFSQEELAEKIGVSRQAVSKWERAEASPDTDNLILLAKIYGVTLDDLLNKDPVEPAEEPTADPKPEDHVDKEETDAPKNDTHISFKNGIQVVTEKGDIVDINLKGISVHTAKEDVHVSFDGIHVEENGHISIFSDENGVHVNTEKTEKKQKLDPKRRRFKKIWNMVPYPVLVCILFFIFGFYNILGGWATSWIMFITVPVYYSIGDMIAYRDLSKFCYPVFVTVLYFYLGFLEGLWHPMWLLYITVPVFYFLCDFIKGITRKTKGLNWFDNDDNEEDDDE